MLVVSYLLPQMVLYINYGRLAAYLWRRRRIVAAARTQFTSKGSRTATTSGGTASGATPVARSTLKTIKMLATVAILFLAAWAPYFTITTIEVIRRFFLRHKTVVKSHFCNAVRPRLQSRPYSFRPIISGQVRKFGLS